MKTPNGEKFIYFGYRHNSRTNKHNLVVHIILPNSESIHQQQITNHAGHTATETNSLSSEVLVVVFIATHSDGS